MNKVIEELTRTCNYIAEDSTFHFATLYKEVLVKLSYVDISFLKGYHKPDKFSLFNKNISQNGIIIVTKEFHDNFFNGNDEFYPKNWTLNFSSY